MANDTLSINKIVSIFRDLALRQKMVTDFGYGPTYNIGASRQMKFPYIWVEQNSTTTSKSDNGYKEAYLSFTIFCMDKISMGDDNYDEIISDTHYILDTMVQEIAQHKYYVDMNLSIDGDINFDPVVEGTDDNVNGWQADITLKMPIRYTPCNSPIEPISGYTTQLNADIAQYRIIGENGTSGTSGISGTSGLNGTSGINGTSGLNGTSGINGTSGTSGSSGTTGTSGSSGTSGTSGTSGINGANGYSSSLFLYKAKTNTYTNNPGPSYILWDNSTQTSATNLHINHLTQDNIDIDIFLALISDGSIITIQHQINSGDYQTWSVNGTPTLITGATNYWIIPVSLLSSTISFGNNADIFIAISANNGTSGTSGINGTSGVNGTSGISGTSGTSGVSGTSGLTGTSGTSGLTGTSGTSGINGLTGTSGTSGISGAAGGSVNQVQFNNTGTFDGATYAEIDNGNLKLLTNSTEPSNPTGGILLYTRNYANRLLPKIIGPSGIETSLQVGLHSNSVFIVLVASGTTAPTVIGGTLTTATTMSLQFTPNSTNRWSATARKRFQTSTTAGNATGMRTAYGQWFRGSASGYGGFWFRTQFGMNINLNGGQKFIGLCNSTGALAADPSALLNMCGMGYDAGDASTGNWFFMYNNGAGTATKVNLGTNAVRNTTDAYELIMFMAPGGSELFVKIVNLQTNIVVLDTSYTDAKIPVVNTAMAFKAEVRNGAVAAADNIEVSKVYIETDY